MISSTNDSLSIILPTYNEYKNIRPIINRLLEFDSHYDLELLVVDDNSSDGTASLVRSIAQKDRRIHLVHRLDRTGLSSAIKEGLLNATGDLVAIMDSDGQHEPNALIDALQILKVENFDLVVGSRFLLGSDIKGLSKRRLKGSSIANDFARISLSNNYSHLTDYVVFLEAPLLILLEPWTTKIRKCLHTKNRKTNMYNRKSIQRVPK